MRGKTENRDVAELVRAEASMRPPHECGGKHVAAALADLDDRASMRPPHECGGKQLFDWYRGDATKGFNEAPARMRGKTGDGRAGLHPAVPASMRPPHECGGKPEAARSSFVPSSSLQ